MLEITSKDNKVIKNIIKLINKPKHRKEQGLFVVEGVRLCTDAVRSGAEIETFICTKDALEKHTKTVEILTQNADNSYVVTPNIFSMISDTQTPQGVICVVKALDNRLQFDKINGKYVLL